MVLADSRICPESKYQQIVSTQYLSHLWMHMIHYVKKVHIVYAQKLIILKLLINSMDYVPWHLCFELGKLLSNLKCFVVRNN